MHCFSSAAPSRSIAYLARHRDLGYLSPIPGHDRVIPGSSCQSRSPANPPDWATTACSRVRVASSSSSFSSSSSIPSSSSSIRAMELKPDPSRHLTAFDDAGKLAEGLADHISKLSAAAIARKGAFTIVLSGGSLVSALTKLAEPPVAEQIDWSRWHVFWVDERVVSKDDPDSSYKLAHDLLLSKVAIPVAQVYSINDALDAEGAAEDYLTLISHSIQTGVVDQSPEGRPKFDLILLGMGPDGHVASLFPNHPLLGEKQRWVSFVTDSPKPPPRRITMTFPVINSAANVFFVSFGASKAEMVARVFGEKVPDGELPAQMVLPADGKLLWFVDQAAAGMLTK